MSYTYLKRLATITTATAKAQNVDFLGSDFQVSRESSRVRVTASVTGASRIRLIPSSGAGFSLASGTSISGSLVTEEITLDPGRTWNVQTDNASGTTVNFLLIDELVPS